VRWRLVAAVVAAVTLVLSSVYAATGETFINWNQFLYSPLHSSDNVAATTITPSNAAKLKVQWTFKPPTAPSGLAGFYSSPTVYRGVIYIGARNGNFYAIDEATGAVKWSRFIGFVTGKTCGAAGFTSTATVAPDPTTGVLTVYVYGASGYLYAMKASDGTDVWPPAAVAIPSTTKNNYYAWDSPLVSRGNIYVGISSQCDLPQIRGGLDVFNRFTGALQRTFWTDPPGKTGASIWSSPATDGTSVFAATGSGQANTHRLSILRLNRSLTKLLDKWQLPVSQRVFDTDFGASPGIWNSSGTEMVGACNKNGTFYALDADSLSSGPVWQDQIGDPFKHGPGECDAAPIFDGSSLYLASNGTTINGTVYGGSVRKVDPATGAYLWQTGLTGPIIGSPTLDGGGVVAAASFGSPTQQNGVFLLNASTGQLIRTIAFGKSSTFAQPVFADNYMFVASTAPGLRAYKVPGT
jgi:outer membrane protein assembly factor BamB